MTTEHKHPTGYFKARRGWDGEGLPPIGAQCLVSNDDGYILHVWHRIVGYGPGQREVLLLDWGADEGKEAVVASLDNCWFPVIK